MVNDGLVQLIWNGTGLGLPVESDALVKLNGAHHASTCHWSCYRQEGQQKAIRKR